MTDYGAGMTTPPDQPPDQPPVAPSQAHPGMASLRSQVITVKMLVITCLALLLMLTLLAVVFGVETMRSREDIAALSVRVEQLASQAAAPRAAAAEASPEAGASKAAVAQLSLAQPISGVTMPSGVDETGAILLGDPTADRVLEVYVDYQCPFCQKWEQTLGESIVEKAMQPDSGLLVKQYVLAFLGEKSATLMPPGASARAGNAALCVLDKDGPAAFAAYSKALFAKADPSEPPGQFTQDVLTALARDGGASEAAVACIGDETFVPFVAASTKSGFARGVGGTPTVVVDGETIGNAFTDATVIGFGAGA